MKKHTVFYLLVLFLPILSIVLLVEAQEDAPPINLITTGSGQRYTESIMVIDINDFDHQPAQLPSYQYSEIRIPHSSLNWGSDPDNPYGVIHKSGPAFMHPGATAHFEISLANYESITHTYRLTDTLPAQLAYVPGSADGFFYNSATRTLTWQGELAPGHLDTVIEESSLTLPYLDLADFGAANLCDDFLTNGEDCDDVTVTFNLGMNGYAANLYGQSLSQLTVSSNGLVLGNNTVANGRNQWLPDVTAPNSVLAGLWRDVDMTANGRFHAAIISGLIEGHDVFYAQWHDAPHANDPDLTARHAIAVILNRELAADPAQTTINHSLTGHAFFIYDNISDPEKLATQGYTIGVEDKLGLRGNTYAYAPCCGSSNAPQGYPPTPGATLHLRPVLFGAENDYHRTFSYEVVVNGQVPETIVNTAVATSSSTDPSLAYVWSTHYLNVRLQTYLPMLRFDEVTP